MKVAVLDAAYRFLAITINSWREMFDVGVFGECRNGDTRIIIRGKEEIAAQIL